MPFKKGQSGNPSGRPKKTDEEKRVKEFLKASSMDAAELMHGTMMDENVKIDIRIACAKEILDRCISRPRQTVESTNVNINAEPCMSLEESLKIIKDLTADG